jgi:hypothetical protein
MTWLLSTGQYTFIIKPRLLFSDSIVWKLFRGPTPATTKAGSPCTANPLVSKVGISSQLATCWKPFVYRPIQPLHKAAILENFIMNLSHSVYREHCIIPYTYPAQNPLYSCLLIHPLFLNKTILLRSSIIFAILTKPIPQWMKFTEGTFSGGNFVLLISRFT